ncbi:recombination protein F [Erythrobacter sp. HA6-11]
MFAASDNANKAAAAVFSLAISAVFFAMAIVPASPGAFVA